MGVEGHEPVVHLDDLVPLGDFAQTGDIGRVSKVRPSLPGPHLRDAVPNTRYPAGWSSGSGEMRVPSGSSVTISGRAPGKNPRVMTRKRVAPAIICFILAVLLFTAGVALRRAGGVPFGLVDAVALAMMLFPVVGLIIATRLPGNRVAWTCLLIGMAWAVDSALWGVALYGMENPGSIARPDMWAALANPLWVPGIFLIPTFLVLFFPDDRLPSPRWRPFAWTLGGFLMVVFAGTFLQPTTSSYGRPLVDNPFQIEGELGDFIFTIWENGVVFILLFAGVVGSIASVIIRFRRARTREREQMKWLVAASAFATALFLPSILLEEVYGQVLPMIAGLSLPLIPMAIGIAITRHGLYNIDRIVSRTISYSVVVAVLAGIYVLAVRWLSSLLPADSAFAVAGSTLAVAAAFNPLRRRVLRWVDRRFNRARYDAEVVVEHFARSLQDRGDPDSIAAVWIDVVVETMEPAFISVWLDDAEGEA